MVPLRGREARPENGAGVAAGQEAACLPPHRIRGLGRARPTAEVGKDYAFSLNKASAN